MRPGKKRGKEREIREKGKGREINCAIYFYGVVHKFMASFSIDHYMNQFHNRSRRLIATF